MGSSFPLRGRYITQSESSNVTHKARRGKREIGPSLSEEAVHEARDARPLQPQAVLEELDNRAGPVFRQRGEVCAELGKEEGEALRAAALVAEGELHGY